MAQSAISYLAKGFLKAVVTQRNQPFLSPEFAYCIHCRRLRSMSWLYHHKRTTPFDPSEEMQELIRSRFETYVGDIITEVDLLNDLGNSFPQPSEVLHQLPGVVPDPHTQEMEEECPPVSLSSSHEMNEPDDLAHEGAESELPFQEERLAQCISDCFEQFCFDSTSFDIKRFASLAETFFGNETERGLSASHSLQSVRAKNLSRLSRKVFVMLSLTKKKSTL